MSWNEARSTKRIQDHLSTVPIFDATISLASHSRDKRQMRDSGLLAGLTNRRAFVVDGAHLYGQLLDFDQLVAEQNGEETEHSHRKLLQFIDLHYQLWDEIVDSDSADRVDYHGGRMHAVVTEPGNDPTGQVSRAYALAVKLTEASQRIASAAGFTARLRFGIDQGRCLAMTTGRSHERDTLFLGAPANHAAKKVAESDEEGIFFADNLQSKLGGAAARSAITGRLHLTEDAARLALKTYQFQRLDLATNQLVARASQSRNFTFFKPDPPLSDLKFSELTPSRTARADMTSIFADIDGFTNFVDQAISKGSEAIKSAATAIHVIREELNDVLRSDFKGKRIRFIGDCIQGVVSGKNLNDDTDSIRTAALCASGMQSSFSLCQKLIGGIDALGLAIGIEHGPTPLTRLGRNGDESVRCAACRAAVVSEKVQQSIERSGIRLGPNASQKADTSIRKYYKESSSIPNFDAAADLLGSFASPAVSIVREDKTARPYFRD